MLNLIILIASMIDITLKSSCLIFIYSPMYLTLTVQVHQDLLQRKRQGEEGRHILDVLGIDRREFGERKIPNQVQAAAALARQGFRWTRILL